MRRRARIRPGWRARLPGRLRRAPSPGDGPLRTDHRHRAVRSARRTGHDRRALRLGASGCSGSSTTAPAIAANARSTVSQGEWPTLRLIHLPVHASWLDQCEIYFSIVQRKVVNPNDFTDLDQIRERLAAFETRYNTVAEPFDWTFRSRRPRQAPRPHRRPHRPSRLSQLDSLPTIDGDADPQFDAHLSGPASRTAAAGALAQPHATLRACPRQLRLHQRHRRRRRRVAAVSAALRRLRRHDGASPSTSPAKTATKTRSFPAARPPAPPKKPSTAPAVSTSTTPPPGPDQHARTFAKDHLGWGW